MATTRRHIGRRVRLLALAAACALSGALFTHSRDLRPAPAYAATFTVTSTNDANDGACTVGGHCSLREAINAANGTTALDQISFSIGAGGVQTIAITGDADENPFPEITQPVIIDGTTQPLFPGTPIVEIDGSNNSSSCLRVEGSGSTIKGLAIFDCFSNGISLAGGGGHTVQGNYIGLDSDGVTVRQNGDTGIFIHSSDNTIGGTTAAQRNVIGGNAGSGIAIAELSVVPTGNVIRGNYIGIAADGVAAKPNGTNSGGTRNGAGILIQGDSNNNTIGGSAAGEGNVISGNTNAGIEIAGVLGNPANNIIRGNLIGVQGNGTSALGNGLHGVWLRNVDGGVSAVTGNQIGGTGAGQGNRIWNNSGDGVRVEGSLITQNIVVQNPIRGNSLKGNVLLGIENLNDGNNELAPPIVTGPNPVFGTSCANCQVDVFSTADVGANGEGHTYEGTVTANASGQWHFGSGITGPFITTTATNAAGDTSQFSSPTKNVLDATPTPTHTPDGPTNTMVPPSFTPTPTNTPTDTPTDTPTPTNTPTSTPTATPCPDADSDALTDCEESALGTDPNDIDTDDDGLLDGLEVLNYSTDPLEPDSDSDNLVDGIEVLLLGTDPLSPDTDSDSCSDGEEIGLNQFLGGRRDPLSRWDLFDVPLPALTVGDASGATNQVVTLGDALAIVYYVGTSNDGQPNLNGVDYDSDLNNNGVEDGREYDRTPSTTPGEPWRSNAPNGAVQLQDALVALNQVGHSCVLAP